jgi:hypothetical protein
MVCDFRVTEIITIASDGNTQDKLNRHREINRQRCSLHSGHVIDHRQPTMKDGVVYFDHKVGMSVAPV